MIVVIGVNPNKKYLVSPQQRVDLLRQMLKDSGSSFANNNNIRVEGMIIDNFF